MKHVLVVEDNAVLREFLVKLIGQLDPLLDVLAVGSYKDAKKAYHDCRIDAFFLDIHLGDGSGYDLSKEIRDIDRYKFKPIVFLTGDMNYQLEAHLDVRCYKYLTKPFKIDELRTVLYDVVSYGIEEDEVRKLTLKARGQHYIIDESDIVYLEYKNRHLHIHTDSETMIFSGYKLSELIDMLSNGFIRCHKSYVVNKRSIHHINESYNCLYVRGIDVRIPIGRKYKPDVQGLYLMS